MSGKNVANYKTFGDAQFSNITIQSTGVGLAIYGPDSSTPIFSFDPITKQVVLDSDVNITGSTTTSTINLAEFDGGIFNIAANNIADATDLGISAQYVNGDEQFTGIARIAGDVLKRWTFFDYINTPPVTTVNGVIGPTENQLAPIRASKIYLNDGTAELPSIVFDGNALKNTGFYRIGIDNIGVSTGGVNRIDIGNTRTNFVTGNAVNVGTTGTTSPLNVYGLITGSNGLIVSVGTSALQALTATAFTASGLSSLQGVTTTSLTASGLITANAGLTGTTLTASGLSSLQGVTTAAITSSGLITANAGLTGTTLTASGLITGGNNIAISSNATLTANGTIASFLTPSLANFNTSSIIFGVNASNTRNFGKIAFEYSSDNSINNRVSYGSGLSNHGLYLNANGGWALVCTDSSISGIIQGAITIAGSLNVNMTLTSNGILTANSGITVVSGTSSLKAVIADGLITGNNGIVISSSATTDTTIARFLTPSLTNSGNTSKIVFGINTDNTRNFGQIEFTNLTDQFNTPNRVRYGSGLNSNHGLYLFSDGSWGLNGSTTQSSGFIQGSVYLSGNLTISETLIVDQLITANAGLTIVSGQNANIQSLTASRLVVTDTNKNLVSMGPGVDGQTLTLVSGVASWVTPESTSGGGVFTSRIGSSGYMYNSLTPVTLTASGTTSSITGTVLTVGGTITDKFIKGMILTGTNVAPNTYITSFGTGVGGSGTYNVSLSQTVADTTITGTYTNSSLTSTIDNRVINKKIRVSRASVATGVSTWFTRTAPSTLNWSSVCWSPELGIFVAGNTGANTTMLSSTDGITWTSNSTGGAAGFWTNICWSPELGIFVAVSEFPGSINFNIMYSSNGTSWAVVSTSTNTSNITCLCWSPELNLFVALTLGGSHLISSTGINGASQNGWTIGSSGVLTNSPRAICWSSELLLFVAVGDVGNSMYYSTNGTAWTLASFNNSDTQWRSVCWSPELYLFVALGITSTGSSHTFATSSDGISWTTVNTGIARTPMYKIIWSNELSIFVATGPNSIITSSDGINWVLRNALYNARSICYSPELSIFVAPSYNSAIIVSTNPIIPASKSALLVNPNIMSVNSSTGVTTLQAITASGLITGTAGLTISSGTSALQAVTGTTGNFTNNSDSVFTVSSGTHTPNQTPAKFLSPSLGIGSYATVTQGVAQTANNSFEHRFYNIGAGSVNNYYALAPLAGPQVFRINAAGATRFIGTGVSSYTRTFTTTANQAGDMVQYSGNTGTATFDIDVLTSGANQTFAAKYKISTRFAVTGGTWRRCIPFSLAFGNTDTYELQINTNNAVTTFRLVHSTPTVASFVTMNMIASYTQNDEGVFSNLTGDALYLDANWATYAFFETTAIIQTLGKVGINTLSPTSTLDVNGAGINYNGALVNTTDGLNTLLTTASKGSFTVILTGGENTGLRVYTNLTPSIFTTAPDGRRFQSWLASKNYNASIRAVGINGIIISFKITSLVGTYGAGGDGGGGSYATQVYSAAPIAATATSNLWTVSGTTLTLTNVNSGCFTIGMILSGTGIAANTVITDISVTVGQGRSGTTATLSISQTNITGSTNTLTGTESAARCVSWTVSTLTTITLTTVSFGYFYVGMVLSGIGITGTAIVASIVSGNGSSGTVVTISGTNQTNGSYTSTLHGATNIIASNNFAPGDYTITIYPIQDIKTGDLLVSNGSIGINTNTPGATLDVVGNGRFVSSTAGIPAISLTQNSIAANDILHMLSPNLPNNNLTSVVFGKGNTNLNAGLIRWASIAPGNTGNYMSFSIQNGTYSATDNIRLYNDRTVMPIRILTIGNETASAMINLADIAGAAWQITTGNNNLTWGNGTLGSFTQKMQITPAGNLSLTGGITAKSLALTNTINGGSVLSNTNVNIESGSFSAFQLISNTGPCTLFLNGSGRSTDGGINTATLRNDNGALRLQNGSEQSTLLLSGTTAKFINAGTSGSNRTLLTLETIESAPGTGGSIDFVQTGLVAGRINSKYESDGNIGLYFSTRTGGTVNERMSINAAGTVSMLANVNPTLVVGSTGAATVPTAIVLQNATDGKLIMGIAGGNGQYSGSAVQGDAVIYTSIAKRLILQAVSGTAGIIINTDNTVTMPLNTYVTGGVSIGAGLPGGAFNNNGLNIRNSNGLFTHFNTLGGSTNTIRGDTTFGDAVSMPKKSQCGFTNGGGLGTGYVAFSPAFNTAPIVIATAVNPNWDNVYHVEIYNVSVNGFEFIKRFQNKNGGVWNFALSETFTWIAMT